MIALAFPPGYNESLKPANPALWEPGDAVRLKNGQGAKGRLKAWVCNGYAWVVWDTDATERPETVTVRNLVYVPKS